MIEAPRISEKEQKQLRDNFFRMIEEYPDQDSLVAFRNEWDGAVHFEIRDDHTVIADIAGEEKLPADLKERVRSMFKKFNQGHH